MPRFNPKIYTLVLAMLAASATVAQAGDAAHAWGTMGQPGQQFLNSAQMQAVSGTTAQQVAAGKDGGPFRSVSACGTCVSITITGNQNSVSGNNINSTNDGTITSNGYFNW